MTVTQAQAQPQLSKPLQTHLQQPVQAIPQQVCCKVGCYCTKLALLPACCMLQAKPSLCVFAVVAQIGFVSMP